MSEIHIDIGSLSPGLQTAYGYLAEGNWRNANDCFDLVLKQTPLDPYACLGKAMTASNLKTPDELNYCPDEILENPFFSAALKYADGQLKDDLTLHVVRMNYDRQKVLAQKPAIEQLNAPAARAASAPYDSFDSAAQASDGVMDDDFENARTAAPADAGQAGEPVPWADDGERTVFLRNSDQVGAGENAGENVDVVGGEKKSKKKIIIPIAIAASLLLIVGAGLVSWFYLIPQMKYNKAVDLINDKQYDEGLAILQELGDFSDAPEQYKTGLYVKALNYLAQNEYDNSRAIFEELGDFKDSQELIGTIEARRVTNKIKTIAAANVGDIVTFGTFETDGNTENGKEALTWQVLSNRDDLVTLITEQSIAAMRYHSSPSATNWADCSLRTWLNDSFFNEAFDQNEVGFICNNYITTPTNPDFPSPSGDATRDKVFLLSLNEVLSYFGSITERKLKCTYASYSNTYLDGNDYCCWWLRTPGAMLESAVCVDTTGKVVTGGYDCYKNEHIGVRPVIRIDISPVSQSAGTSSDTAVVDDATASDAIPGNASSGVFSNETTSGSASSGGSSTGPFTNVFGTPTTICAHPGCKNYIASSGDTNCCTVHSSKCMICGKYIDEGNTYCMDCSPNVPESTSSPASSSGNSSSGDSTSVSLSSVSLSSGDQPFGGAAASLSLSGR